MSNSQVRILVKFLSLQNTFKGNHALCIYVDWCLRYGKASLSPPPPHPPPPQKKKKEKRKRKKRKNEVSGGKKVKKMTVCMNLSLMLVDIIHLIP